MTLNKAMLIGRLTRDPELRYMPNGKPVVNFSIATDEGYGENKRSEYHNIVVFGRSDGARGTAETINDYARKGSLVYVEGRLQTRSWEGQDGSKRRNTEIVVNQFQFLSSPKNAKPDYGQADPAITEVDPADIPF